MKRIIDDDKIVELRKKGLLMREIGEHFGVSKQAVHARLKKLGEDGLTPKWCSYCEKWKLAVNKQCKWGKICDDCFSKKKRVKKYKWSCDYEKCIDCGTTKRRHRSRGRCDICSTTYRYRVDPAFRKQKQKDTLNYYYVNRDERLAQMKVYNSKNK